MRATARQDLDRLLATLPATCPEPSIQNAADGEAGMFWRLADHGLHVDAGCYGDGTYSLYARAADGREWFRDDVPVDDGLPADIITILMAGR